MWVRGLATTPVPECGCVTLNLVSPGEAAPIAQWLRDEFIPSPDLLRYSSEGVMETGDESHWELPVAGSVAEIEDALRTHIAEVEEE